MHANLAESVVTEFMKKRETHCSIKCTNLNKTEEKLMEKRKIVIFAVWNTILLSFVLFHR